MGRIEAMTQREKLRGLLIFTLFLLAAGGWMLHFRIHPLVKAPENIIPYISGIISVIVIVPLFCFKRTLAYGYVLNGMTVIIGTITMAHFSLEHLPAVRTLSRLFFESMLPDIGILWAKFTVGKVIFDLEMFKYADEAIPKGRFFRYPNMGWWWVHLIAISVVYLAGYLLWT
jgi:hypothetical protein